MKMMLEPGVNGVKKNMKKCIQNLKTKDSLYGPKCAKKCTLKRQ